MSDSVQPYRLQPARPLCPWDSVGKSTRGGCHALLQGIFPTQGSNLGLCAVALSIRHELRVFGKNMAEVKCPTHHLLSGGTVNPCSITGEVYSGTCQRRMHACSVISVVSDSLRRHGLQPTRLLSLWDFPGKSTGVGCRALLQGIFPTQES